MARIAVLGTGMAGFGAWHRLRGERHEVILYDKNENAGGHTSSWTFEPGFTFDHGPHVSFTNDERIRQILADNVDGQFEEVQYKVNNYWRGHWVPHPVQCHLHGLPTELVTRVIADFVAQSEDSIAQIRNYEDWLRIAYGRAFAEEFPEVYTRKYHTTPSRNLTTEWIGPRMYRPTLEEVLRGALAPEAPNVHYVKGFRYPSQGGFARYLHKWADEAPIALAHKVIAIDPAAHVIDFENGSVEHFDHLISSVPLPELVELLPDVPEEVSTAAGKLACTGCVLVNLGINRPNISNAHISYFYDPEIAFARLSFPYLMSPNNAPHGTASIQAEVYYSRKYAPLQGKPKDYIEPVIRDVIRCGIVRSPEEVIYRGAMLVEYANIIFDHDRSAAVEKVHRYLDELDIAWCGRYGDWGYIWTDEAFQSGERAAEMVISRAAEAPLGLRSPSA
jgi:protoporphyrinogen oxidase